MRVTNKMMTNNMIYNINNNKVTMSKLEEQYATGLKIQRPSEDPIVAVRALKLRTNLAELNQYYEKNIPDARAWMEVTESALRVIDGVLEQVHTYCVQGANDPLNEGDRQGIVKTLSELKQQVYQEGNSNYAGRYVFTGYKTDTSLVFSDNVSNLNYKMEEILTGNDIDIIKRSINSCEWDADAYDITDPDSIDFGDKPNIVTTYRMMLAYDNLSREAEDFVLKINLYNDIGEWEDEEIYTVERMNSTDRDAFTPGENEIYLLEDTGELIFGSAMYVEFKEAKDIRVVYEKNEFKKNDLRPEHYFDCEVTDLDIDDDDEREEAKITYTKANQEIRYEVNFNQKLVINTQGADAIKHEIGRTVDELVSVVNEVIYTQSKIDKTEKMLQEDGLTPEQIAKLNEMLEILKTEFTLKTEVMQNTFEKALTKMEKQQSLVNASVADSGSRMVRLNLTESRLSTEQVDFEDLLSSNEDAELTDTIIKFRAREAVYNASLAAAARVVQNTLLDFL